MNQQLQAPYFRKVDIARRVKGLHDGYFNVVGNEQRRLGINFDHIYNEYIYPELGIQLVEDVDLGYDESGEKILGLFQPNENIAFIDRMLKQTDDPRRTFTCWHEVGGHGILQGEWLRTQLAVDDRYDSIVTTAQTLSPKVEGVLEVQANIFAGLAAAPDWLVDHAIMTMFRLSRPKRYVGSQRYSFDVLGTTYTRHVSSFDEFCQQIARPIQRFFGRLSVEALGYRVAESRCVFDATKTRMPPNGFSLRRTARPQTSSSYGGCRLQVEFSNVVSELSLR